MVVGCFLITKNTKDTKDTKMSVQLAMRLMPCFINGAEKFINRPRR